MGTSFRLPGKAKPGGRRRRRRPAARDASPVAPGRQDSLLSFTSVLPSLRFQEQQILFLKWIVKGVRLHGQTHTPSRNNPVRVWPALAGGLRDSGKRGRGGVGRPGPLLPETAGGGEVPGGCPSSPPGCAPLSFFIAAALACLR